MQGLDGRSQGFAYTSLKDLEGKRIATSYPNTVKQYLEKKGITADIHIINGSVEIAPNIGLADAICDIVSSGSTLFKNNLKEVEVMLKSEPFWPFHPLFQKHVPPYWKKSSSVYNPCFGQDPLNMCC